MKTKGNNKLDLAEGKARFYAKVKARNRWADPAVPEYDPNWLVRFSVLGKSWLETAPVPVAMGLPPVKRWATERIRTEAHLLLTGKLEELQRMRAPQKVLTLAELRAVYLSQLPPVNRSEYVRNFDRLARIWTEVSGLEEAEIPVTDAFWSVEKLDRWVRMRQESFRRGWSVRGAAPVDAWAQLREAKLPGIDRRTMCPGNTTILSYLRCARAVFAWGGRYLRGVGLPKLEAFLNYSPGVLEVKGHREIQAEVMDRIVAGLPALKVADERAWLLLQMLAWTGARPTQVLAMGADALLDGYVRIPAAKRGKEVLAPLPVEVMGVLREVATDASIIGVPSRTAAGKVMRRVNAWLTAQGLDDTHKAYLFRHKRGQELRAEGGKDLVAVGLGHRNTTMAERYSEARAVVPLVDPWAARVG